MKDKTTHLYVDSHERLLILGRACAVCGHRHTYVVQYTSRLQKL